MRARWSLVLVLSGCTATADQGATAPEPPTDVAWVAAFAVDDDGRIVSAGPVTRRGGADVGAALPDDWAGGQHAWVVGFSAESFERDGVEPPDAAVRLAGPDDVPLPAPIWVATGSIVDGQANLSVTTERPPAIAVDGGPGCVMLFPELTSLVDVRCRYRPCDPVVRQDGCQITIDTESCELPIYKGELVGRSTFRGANCQSLEMTEDAALRVQCVDGAVDCTIVVYANGVDLGADVIRQPLYGPFVTLSREGYEVLGYFAGLAMVGDDLIVGGHSGQTIDGSCLNGVVSELVRLDPTTLEVRSRVPTVPCLRRLIAHPDGTSLLALAGAATDVAIVQLGLDGTVIRGPIRLAPPELTEYDRIVLHHENRYASFIEVRRTGRGGRVRTFDLSAFEFFSASEWAPTYRDIEDARRPDTLIIVDEDEELLRFYDFKTATLTGAQIDVDPCLFGFDPRRILTMPDGRAFISGEENNSALAQVMLGDPTQSCVGSHPFIEATDLRAPIGELSNGDIVVAGRNYAQDKPEKERRAFLSVYRPERGAFLPSKIDIGLGIPDGTLMKDDVAYVLLPWAGDVVRVAF